jgi:hypothetical protein
MECSGCDSVKKIPEKRQEPLTLSSGTTVGGHKSTCGVSGENEPWGPLNLSPEEIIALVKLGCELEANALSPERETQ